MIGGIKIINGFFTELPGFHPNQIFEFTDGLNVLYGPNGCGKSSVLKMLKAYSGIPNDKGGWTRVSDSIALGTQSASHFPYAYREYSPGQSDCAVLWDGSPTFYNEGDVKTDQWAWFTHKEILSEDGMTSENELFDNMHERPSSGQYRMKKINKLFNLLGNPPNILDASNKTDAQLAEISYFKTLPRNGKTTILLDEPERALSLPKQLELFKLLEEKSKDYQIIIATHSPFVLWNLNAKMFDMQTGYMDECVNIFKELNTSQLTFNF